MHTQIKHLGCQDYLATWQKMRNLTAARNSSSPDQIWLLEHPPVYTLGLAGKMEHLLATSTIPVVKSDRGGQITYHGPGQAVVYLLFDLARSICGVRQLLGALEQAMITALGQYGIGATTVQTAPGVYVGSRKIGSVGLRVRHGCCYHGLSLNNNMDLAPFANINVCGYKGLGVTQLADLGVTISTFELAVNVVACLADELQQYPKKTQP